ncbi:hypothetical protein ADUPG1_006485 [Aduncisulcus paluster]|uniref:Uncharacterized protein n=1 Tax=Aduncisulcus paluster TaxID=2918883 RepID=A0ABQ5KIF8_9EUKA|nr:hypothetical protein ADUPG1_006485 [Aduncisulcus paluster]
MQLESIRSELDEIRRQIVDREDLFVAREKKMRDEIDAISRKNRSLEERLYTVARLEKSVESLYGEVSKIDSPTPELEKQKRVIAYLAQNNDNLTAEIASLKSEAKTQGQYISKLTETTNDFIESTTSYVKAEIERLSSKKADKSIVAAALKKKPGKSYLDEVLSGKVDLDQFESSLNDHFICIKREMEEFQKKVIEEVDKIKIDTQKGIQSASAKSHSIDAQMNANIKDAEERIYDMIQNNESLFLKRIESQKEETLSLLTHSETQVKRDIKQIIAQSKEAYDVAKTAERKAALAQTKSDESRRVCETIEDNIRQELRQLTHFSKQSREMMNVVESTLTQSVSQSLEKQAEGFSMIQKDIHVLETRLSQKSNSSTTDELRKTLEELSETVRRSREDLGISIDNSMSRIDSVRDGVLAELERRTEELIERGEVKDIVNGVEKEARDLIEESTNHVEEIIKKDVQRIREDFDDKLLHKADVSEVTRQCSQRASKRDLASIATHIKSFPTISEVKDAAFAAHKTRDYVDKLLDGWKREMMTKLDDRVFQSVTERIQRIDIANESRFVRLETALAVRGGISSASASAVPSSSFDPPRGYPSRDDIGVSMLERVKEIEQTIRRLNIDIRRMMTEKISITELKLLMDNKLKEIKVWVETRLRSI